MWFESSIRWRARLTLRALRVSWRLASVGEDGWLLQHLSRNARTVFGLTHHFADLSSPTAFRRAVPVRSFEDQRRAADELRRGLHRGLTVQPPACLAVSQDGEVPLAAESRRVGADLWRLWAAGVERAHPGALAGSYAVVPEATPGRSLRTRARGVPVIASELAPAASR